ncbi:hypothetical protein BASA61_002333 [Batrachochytrium salamandrivorans]|nr:hypothetical protein BASA61_002333 [Batrachochytrium salamandrivorans]
MKLISFVAISLLAITVSAQVLPSTSSVEYTQQHNQYNVDEKLTELREAYKTEMEKDLKLEDFWLAKREDLEKAKEQCDNAKIALHTIEENQRRIKQHDDIRQNQVEILPCSYYNIDILKIQSDEVCKNAKSLATYNKKIKTDVSKPDTVMHKTKNPKKSTHPAKPIGIPMTLTKNLWKKSGLRKTIVVI